MQYIPKRNKSSSKISKRSKAPNLVLLGLDNSGKSTLIATLKNMNTPILSSHSSSSSSCSSIAPPPTETSVRETIRVQNRKLTITDTSGSFLARHLWPKEARKASALVYVVDASDMKRIRESTLELHNLYNPVMGVGAPGATEPVKADIPLVIIASKYDKQDVMSVETIKKVLELDNLPSKNWVVIPCSSKTGLNLQPALMWVTKKAFGEE